ncbi:MAG: polysaccharide biosynthesis/export family protein, partial [Phycisphaerales bacterium]|nr:polysaccharide biosynthesis/export family protein [Phycisphaerales bacterium]
MSQWSMQKVAGSPAKRVSVALLLATLAGGLGGCETDSWFNPAQVGRMENTPTIVPVLDRINSVEGGDAANPNSYSQVTAEDLQVEPESYRMGPGDGIVVKVQDFFEIGKEEMFERVIDDRGFVELPRVGPIFIAGQTGDEAGQTVSRALKTRRILMDPTVDVNAVQRRRQTYSILGGVLNPGTYTIPRPDFRLLEALSNSGRFSENVQWVYVIRTVSLGPTPTGAKGTAAPAGTPAANPAAQPGTGAPPKKDSVIDLIDSLGGPEPTPANPPSQPPAQPPAKPTGNPGDMGLVSAQPGAAP